MSDGGARAGFNRAMLIFTLCYWAVAYLVFTLRSFALQQPYLEVQALLRLAMMPVGLLLCAGLFAAYIRLAGQSVRRQAVAVPLLVFTAGLAYSTINYVVFYVLPGLWRTELGPVAKIGEYVTTTGVWLFGLWTAVFYFTKARMALAAVDDAAGSEGGHYEQDIWVREHDRSVRVPLSDVIWMEAERDYVRFHTEERSYLFRSTMTKLEHTLDPTAFVRIHRRTIISAGLLASLHRRRDGRVFAELSNGVRLPVGRHYLSQLKSVSSAHPVPSGEPAAKPFPDVDR